ncbi:melatonin receptor type 1B-B-like [Antedon mediterranea]|uniref:melatonin receptor type 1B-B-like n=1 Tax=Antedon mediterranea TaxID=105859 RepID=UPI003AF437CA
MVDEYANETGDFVSSTINPSPVLWPRGELIFQVFCLSLIMVIGIIGNGLVIVSVIISRQLRTVTNVYVVNLAVTDLLTVLNIPLTIIAMLSDSNGWPLADWLCVFTGASLVICVTSSIYTLAMIAISRLLVVTRSHVGNKSLPFKRHCIITALVFIWSISIFMASIPAIFGVGQLGYDTRYYSSCTWDWSHSQSSTYNVIVAASLYPVPFLVIVTCYLIIFRHFHKHTEKMMVHTNTITQNLFYVVVVYVMCITPFVICLSVVPRGGSIKATPYAAVILMINSCINPLIYAVKHPHFKGVFKSILTCDLKRIADRPHDIRNT